MDIKNRNVNVWFVAAVLLVVSGVAFGARIGQYIYTDRLYKGNGELIWNFANGDLPVSGATVIVSKEGDYTVARWWNGTVLAKDTRSWFVFQKALNETSKIKGKVIVMEGDYYIPSTTLIFPSNVELEGVGKVNLYITWHGYFPASVGYALITNMHYNSGGDKNIVIKNINFIGSLKVSWPAWEKGSRFIVFKNVSNLVMENCYLEFFNSGGELHIWDSKNVTLRNVRAFHNISARNLTVGDAVFKVTGEHIRISECTANGGNVSSVLAFNLAGNDIVLENSHGLNAHSGCWIETPTTRNVRVIGNFFENVTNEGIGVSVGTSQLTDAEVIISNNRIKPVYGAGIMIGGSSKVVATGNIISDCGSGILIRASENCIISDNIIDSCDVGINVMGGKYNDIHNNRIVNSSIGVKITGGTYYYVSMGAYHNSLRFNLINASDTAVDEYGSADFNVIESNVILSGTITKVGSNTVVRNNIGYRTENSGVAIVANGDYIAHGLVSTPTRIILTANYTQPVHVQVISENSTHFQVGIWNATGSPVTTPIPIYWEAMVE